MAKVLMLDPEKCTACRMCELACSFFHEKEFRPSVSRINVLTWESDGISVPMMCLQCDAAACLKVCPSGALSCSKETGALIVDNEKCIRCKMCLSACPFGNTTYDAATNKILKCDLCGGDPQCVKFCPSGAVTYVEAMKGTLLKKKTYAEKFKELLREVKQ
ncbi:MAG: 4Fe-4S dicluster domain-containing protein [Bacillota bacterium]|nr:4Fe-4S dicluster domain-containing protein [Bacillota bacterium]